MARFIMRYRGYNYINKNPVIDKVKTILQDEGLYSKKQRSTLHKLTGVAVGTFDGWFEGDTRNPQHGTIMATLGGIGYEEQFVKSRKLDIEKELEVAAAFLIKQQEAKDKFKKANPNGKAKTNGANGHKAKKGK